MSSVTPDADRLLDDLQTSAPPGRGVGEKPYWAIGVLAERILSGPGVTR